MKKVRLPGTGNVQRVMQEIAVRHGADLQSNTGLGHRIGLRVHWRRVEAQLTHASQPMQSTGRAAE